MRQKSSKAVVSGLVGERFGLQAVAFRDNSLESPCSTFVQPLFWLSKPCQPCQKSSRMRRDNNVAPPNLGTHNYLCYPLKNTRPVAKSWFGTVGAVARPRSDEVFSL